MSADTITTGEIVHRIPDGDAGLTPCCGRSPLELSRTDRITPLDAMVTCHGPTAAPTTRSPVGHPAAMPTSDRARFRRAAYTATRLWPDAVGALVAKELDDWETFAWRLTTVGRVWALVAAVEAEQQRRVDDAAMHAFRCPRPRVVPR